MRAMVLEATRTSLVMRERPTPEPKQGEILVWRLPRAAYAAPTCMWSTASCRTRLEELDGQARRHFRRQGAGVGKTRRVTAQGSAAGRNDIMLYAIVQAESREAASKMFEDHPHLGIPQSSIEIMEIHALPGTF